MPDFIPTQDDDFDQFATDLGTSVNDPANPLGLTPAQKSDYTTAMGFRWVNTRSQPGPWSEITGHLIN